MKFSRFVKNFKIFMIIISSLISILLILGLVFYIQDLKRPIPQPKDMQWGVTFSQKMTNDLGLNWQETYQAILNDLHPKSIRLTAYWDLLQPTSNTWDFEDLDWQVNEASKHNTSVIIAIGQKVPRWPECYYPSWLNKNNQTEREQRLLTHLQKVAQHYKDSPNLLYWQVENEPFLRLKAISCPKTSYRFVQSEVEVVKKVDPNHQILLTDSGQVGSWYKAARLGDAFGITFYRKVNRPFLGQKNYPYLPGRFSLIRWLNRKPNQSQMLVELQAEPWGQRAIGTMTPAEQTQLFSLQDFRDNVDKAKTTGLNNVYFWGVEWWYSLKIKGNSTYWDVAKDYIQSSQGEYNFPPGFLWGAATSSYQVEGGNSNDWSEWEKQQKSTLVQNGIKQFSQNPNWNEIKNSVTNPNNYISGRVADEYNRYKEDFTSAQSLGMNAQRISLEWSRIEPQNGQFDETAIAHYQAVIADLQAKHMEPFVTLWHYTLPIWFRDKGGWQSKTAVADYNRYVEKVIASFPEVHFWQTLNEPDIYTNQAYLLGSRPPQKDSLLAYWQVHSHLIVAHKQAYATIKKLNPRAQVGIAQDIYSFEPTHNHWYNYPFVAIARWWANQYFLNHIQHQQDFIGVNYYLHVPIGLGKDKKQWVRSDLGWRLYPEGIYQALRDMARYHKPIYITENGLADGQDKLRSWYIKNILIQVNHAMQDGVNVRGYFYWSLIDNFEWDKGHWPQFGLISIDNKTLARTIRPSAYDYAKIIQNNGVTDANPN